MAGMRAVAKLAGVSLSTVSVVLGHGDKFVSEENRKAVLEAAEQLGYHLPEKRRTSPKALAITLPNTTSSFFVDVFNGFGEVTAQEGLLMLMYNSNYDFERELAYIKSLKKQAITGLVLGSVCPREREEEYFAWLNREFTQKGVPVVVIETKQDWEGIYNICVDNYKSAYMAVKYLIDSGHTRIAHIVGSEKNKFTDDRLAGYRQALEDAGIAFDPELLAYGDYTPFSGYTAMRQLLMKGVEFSALFAGNDQMAIGAIKAAKAQGRDIPGEIAVVGFDNISVSSMIEPALTTVNVPCYQMGRLAASLIRDTLAGKKCERMHLLETNLIIRRSSCEGATNEWDLTGW
ncbi:MAG: LacI family DNA-binding transcriptional regulator [Butyricicoccaceae bacterium]